MKYYLKGLGKLAITGLALWGVTVLFDKYNILLILYTLWLSYSLDKLRGDMKFTQDLADKNIERLKIDMQRRLDRCEANIEHVQTATYKNTNSVKQLENKLEYDAVLKNIK